MNVFRDGCCDSEKRAVVVYLDGCVAVNAIADDDREQATAIMAATMPWVGVFMLCWVESTSSASLKSPLFISHEYVTCQSTSNDHYLSM